MPAFRRPLSLLLMLAATLAGAQQPPAVTDLLRSAQLWDAKNRPDLAHMALEKLLLAYPDQPEALLQMGLMELRAGHPDAAAKLLARAKASRPDDLRTRQFDDIYRIATRDHLKMATIRRLSEKGQDEQAIAQLRALLPDVPPAGQLGLDYYRIISHGPGGWEEARAGYERLVRENPDEPKFALALADHLLDRPAGREEAMRILAGLADNPTADHARVLELWRSAIGHSPDASAAMMSAYLKQAPDDKDMQQRLEARSHPGARREVAASGGKQPHATGAPQARPEVNPVTAAMAAALSRKWTEESAAARQQGKPDLADAKLRAASAVTGEHYYDMSVIAHGLLEKGYATDAEAIDRGGLTLDPGSNSLMRGLLEALSKTGRSDEALSTLLAYTKAYPDEASSFNYVHASLLRENAAEAIEAGHAGQALRMLETAQSLEPSDPWIRFDLAKLYARLGLEKQARALMDEGVALAQPGDTGIYYAYSLLLANLKDDRAAMAMLDRIPPSQRTDGMNRHEQRLQAMARRREIDAELSKADEAGDTAAQRAIYARYVAQYPDDPDLRLSYAQLLRRHGYRSEAEAQLDLVLGKTPETDQDTRLAVAREMIALGDLRQAHGVVDPMLQQAPVNPDALVMAGRLARAEHRYDVAMDYFQQARNSGKNPTAQTYTYTGADEQIASLEDLRRGGFVTSGPSFRNKPGDPGVTAFTDLELPVEWRQPLGYDSQFFVHVDPVSAGAGRLPAVYDQAALYGKVQAYGPGSLAAFPDGVTQVQRGADIGAGYQNENLRVDLGTTPIGFLVQDIVGGIRYDGSLGPSDYSINLSRRPVTSSLLSYAGVRDPVTGEVWGGVRSSGADLRLARYEGGWSASASASYQHLTGRNVPDNNYLSARVSGGLNLINRADLRLSVDLAATKWSYSKDLSHYTFGQGGYYSPRSYASLGIPTELTGRIGKFSYQLRGFVSRSWTRTIDSPFYPTDPALQAQALASPLPSGYSSPVYGGSTSSGIGYSAKGALEYQLGAETFIGGAVNIDRAAYYAPNFFTVYLRRMFDPWHKAVPYPPQPPKPYSQY